METEFKVNENTNCGPVSLMVLGQFSDILFRSYKNTSFKLRTLYIKLLFGYRKCDFLENLSLTQISVPFNLREAQN